MKTFPAFLALMGCLRAASGEPFEVLAYEAPGMKPAAGEIIIRDARTRVPAILKSCGIADPETVEATDGVVLFRFVAPAAGKEIGCARQRLPAGARLQPGSSR